MTPRAALVASLKDYLVCFPDEGPMASRIVALVEAHDDCYVRTCRPGHLTGSAWVVSSDATRHLLLHHRKLGKWLQPGGHADGQTDLAAVARREAYEETGLEALRLVEGPGGLALLDVDVHVIPARRAPDGSLVDDAHEHHDLRFLLQTDDDTLRGNDESHEVRWCTDAEVRQLTQEESVLRLLDKAQQRLQ